MSRTSYQDFFERLRLAGPSSQAPTSPSQTPASTSSTNPPYRMPPGFKLPIERRFKAKPSGDPPEVPSRTSARHAGSRSPSSRQRDRGQGNEVENGLADCQADTESVQAAGIDLLATTAFNLDMDDLDPQRESLAPSDTNMAPETDVAAQRQEQRDLSLLASFVNNPREHGKAAREAEAAARNVLQALEQCEHLLGSLQLTQDEESISNTLCVVETVVARERENMLRIKHSMAHDSVQRASATLDRVQMRLEAYRLIYPDKSPLDFNNEHLQMDAFPSEHAAPSVAYCLALTSRIFHGTSRQGAGLVLKMTKLYGYSLTLLAGGPNILQQQALRQTPEDVRTIEKRINLGIRTVPYAVCPSCHCTYKPTYAPTSSAPLYPKHCREDLNDGSERLCGSALVVDGSPIKVFEYHPFFEWFGRFIALPGIQDHGDQFCASIDEHALAPSTKCGVADGTLVRTLPAPGGGGDRFFIADRGDEKRWVFALHVDFFNVEGNRQRGRTASTGHIVMVCLNLPLDVRNDDAYKYLVAIIQGPEEPSAKEGQHRHYLRPLIDDFKVAFERGVRFSCSGGSGPHKASSALSDRHVHRMVLAVLIADFKASRPCAGLLDVTSHSFCSFCKCWIQAWLGRLDHRSWQAVDDNVTRVGAHTWKHASRKERKAVEEKYAARDSAFWDLGYWRPSIQVAVDPMHTWFLGILQRFFREALRLDSSHAKDGDPPDSPAYYYDFTPPPSLDSLNHTSNAVHGLSYRDATHMGLIHKRLTAVMEDTEADRNHLRKKLTELSKPALLQVCRDLNGEIGVSRHRLEQIDRKDLADLLVTWRMSKPLPALPWTKVDYEATMPTLQRAIREITTPSWIGKDKPPVDIGQAKAGTLKASSPYALPQETSMKPILDLTMNLTSGTIALLRPTVTDEGRTMFLEQLEAHVSGLRRHFPGFMFPVYHMAFHLPAFMTLLGPARNWWCFPFERLAGKLQRIPKSHRAGDSEHTMLHSFAKGSIFRQWLLRPDCPPLLQYCRSLVDKAYEFAGFETPSEAYDDDIDGVDIYLNRLGVQNSTPDYMKIKSDVRNYTTEIDEELSELIGTDDVVCYSRLPASNGFYSTKEGNSHICALPSDGSAGRWTAARIRHIFEKQGVIQFAIQRARPRPGSHPDPFLDYWQKGFEAQHVSSKFRRDVEIIDASRVIAHVARWAFDDGTALVLNLSDRRTLALTDFRYMPSPTSAETLRLQPPLHQSPPRKSTAAFYQSSLHGRVHAMIQLTLLDHYTLHPSQRGQDLNRASANITLSGSQSLKVQTHLSCQDSSQTGIQLTPHALPKVGAVARKKGSTGGTDWGFVSVAQSKLDPKFVGPTAGSRTSSKPSFGKSWVVRLWMAIKETYESLAASDVHILRRKFDASAEKDERRRERVVLLYWYPKDGSVVLQRVRDI
ncbi:uncharacterized protein SCHCODRAFT_02503420 [Schizophyllum commune H4-8]|uniref:Transposase family Tnp2 protein n=1 Tax=Schizophyllum commune (strain H4-8 / FGSC 9210) TaxID=578458 RepID=D8Q641_SCHCM|nr:uncharacterized protein SCHCODRAFT_02503420 [Schizophyllum commune H4-8]KAI5891921.1 hypothetical protein SCHCODRAFT_02503420 [Schizophyllum commune H4-8]